MKPKASSDAGSSADKASLPTLTIDVIVADALAALPQWGGNRPEAKRAVAAAFGVLSQEIAGHTAAVRVQGIGKFAHRGRPAGNAAPEKREQIVLKLGGKAAGADDDHDDETGAD